MPPGRPGLRRRPPGDRPRVEALLEEFLARYHEEEGRSKPGGGNWYRNTVRDLGKGYVRLVADAHQRRVIDSYTAATYLNLKVSQIPRFATTAAIAEAA